MGRNDITEIQGIAHRKTGKEHNKVAFTCRVGGIVKKRKEEGREQGRWQREAK
jgi:hypothetical protein